MERDQNIEIRERERVPILRGKKIYDPLIKTYFGHLRKKFVLFMLSLSGLEKLRKNLVAYRTFSRPSMDHPGHVTFFFLPSPLIRISAAAAAVAQGQACCPQ